MERQKLYIFYGEIKCLYFLNLYHTYLPQNMQFSYIKCSILHENPTSGASSDINTHMLGLILRMTF